MAMTDEDFKAKLKELLIEHLEIEVSCDKDYDYGRTCLNITIDISFDEDHIHRTYDSFTIQEAE